MSVRHVLGYRWDATVPYLVVRETPAGGAVARRPLFGPLALRPQVERFCLGLSNGANPEARLPCPDAVELTGTRARLCQRCQRRWTFRYWLSFDGTEAGRERLPAEIQALGERPYVVYLAGFGAGPIKVGISSSGRRQERLLEQGALVGGYVAATDGFGARALELAIAQLGYAERIRRGRKPTTVTPPAALDELRDRIRSAYRDVREQLPAELAAPLHEPELHDFTSIYRLPALTESPTPIRPDPGHDLAGEVVAVRGDAVVVRSGRDGRLVTFHLRDLEGQLVDLDPAAPAPSPPSLVQPKLL